MNIERSFVFAFKSPGGVKKLLLGGVFSLPILAPTIFFPIAVMGYLMRVLCDALEGRDAKLPEWRELGRLFNEGLMPTLVLLGWLSPCIALAVAFQLVIGTLELGLSAVMWIGLAYLILELALGVLLSVVLPLALMRLAIKRSLRAAFELGKMLEFLRANKGTFFTAWGLALAVGAVASVGVVALVVGLFFTGFIANVIMMHLFAQAYRASRPFADDRDGALRASMAIPPPLEDAKPDA